MRPLRWSWPPLAVMPSLRSAPGTLPPSMSSGSSIGGDDGGALVGIAEQLEADRGGAGAGGAGEDLVACEHVLQALLLDQAERDVEPEEQRHGGRERARALALALGGLAPVEVEAAAGRASAYSSARADTDANASPGGHIERLLRAGDDDVDAPVVLAQLGRAEARDGVDGEDDAVALGHLGDRLDVVDDAGGGLAERRERDLDALVLGQQAVDRGRIQARAPARLVAHLVGAVRLTEADPALAELAGGAHEDLVTGAHEVRERRLQRTRTARGEREHVVLRAEDGRQLGQHALVHLVEGGRAVVEHRRGHRLRDGGRDGRRPGGHQVLLGERIGRHAGGLRLVGRCAAG